MQNISIYSKENNKKTEIKQNLQWAGLQLPFFLRLQQCHQLQKDMEAWHSQVSHCQPGPPALSWSFGLCSGLVCIKFYFPGYECNFYNLFYFWQSVSVTEKYIVWLSEGSIFP